MNAVLKTKSVEMIALPYGLKRPAHIGVGDPFTIRMTVTPEIAERWLKRNTSNRPLNKGNLRFLMHEITTGRFRFNGESIQFDKIGTLQNGQHRLEAVVRSKTAIDTNVTVGLDSAMFHTIDTGKTRTAGDVLAIAGIEDYNTSAAIAKFIFAFERKYYDRLKGSKGLYIDHGQILEFVEKTPDFPELVTFALSVYKKSGYFLPPSIIGGLCYFMQKKDRQRARKFFTDLCLGINISEDSPLFLLRRRLADDKRSKEMKLRKAAKSALIIKAWNAFRGGKTIKRLNYSRAEKFPVIL